MNIIDLGYWEAYRFTAGDGLEIAKYRNAAGYDWYSTVAHNPNRPMGVTAVVAPDGAVIIAYNDVAQAEPRLGRVVVLEGFDGSLADLVGKRVNLAAGIIERHVTDEAINFERARRESVGCTVEVSGYGPIPIQGRPTDKTNMQALALAASLRQQAGTEQITVFRDAVNADHQLTNAQMIEVYAKGTAWIENLYKASWAIKALDPLPQDYDDDSHWTRPAPTSA
ncbi:DUF4376 domain-containing protein [Bosea sp. TAB14]|uniref:DUF4376 domain-containing protein n=1 Tax=Bosea sp. TAB14 TaxID=3237481 RepID=UPI003F8F5483